MQDYNKPCTDSESFTSPIRSLTRTYGARHSRLIWLLTLLGLSARAQAEGPIMPVHLRVGGREVACKTSPVADDHETYVPLEALTALGLEGKQDNKGEIAHVTILSTQKRQDIAFARPNGKSMLALSEIARLVNGAIVRTEKMGRDNKPIVGSRGDTVYLLAHVTDVRFERGAVRVTTSFPVPFHARMITDEKPLRGYVDCVGADVEAKFQPAPVPLSGGEKQVVKVRAAQYSIDTARVVVELPQGVVMKFRDMNANPSAIIVAETNMPGTKVASASTNEKGKSDKSKKDGDKIARALPPTSPFDKKSTDKKADKNRDGDTVAKPMPVAPTDQGERVVLQQPGGVGADKTAQFGSANNPPNVNAPDAANSGADTLPSPPSTAKLPTVAGGNPVRPSLRGKSPSRGGHVKRDVPIEVRGLALVPDGDTRVHLDIATSDAAGTYIHYIDGSKLAVDLPNTLLHLPDGVAPDQTLTHPLLSGIHAELIQETPPLTRVTIDTSRFVGFTVNNQANKVSVELRLPRNATGVLADKVIVVDAGHGGSSTGATAGGFMEKNITLQMALKLRDILEACGAKVVMTRDKDVDVNLYDRPYLANDINADLFVSIHNDSFTSECRGTSTYFHMSDPSSRALANSVQQAIAGLHEVPSKGALSDGILYNSGLAVLRASKMPAILVEVAYISNTQDRRKLTDSDFQQHVAQAICDGLRSYVEGGTPQGGRRMGLDMPDAPPLPLPDDTTNTLK